MNSAFEEIFGTLALAVVNLLASSAFSIAAYILTALALYTIAKRRGLHNPWLAWIPVANMWLLGSISDQYRYVVKNQVKSKRKVLLVLYLILTVLTVTVLVLAVGITVKLGTGMLEGYSEEYLFRSSMRTFFTVVALMVPIFGVSIASLVVRYMALYDLYQSLEPQNCVMYLVLSIVFSVTEPFFLFFNRKKDLGMPPRRPEPAPREPDWQLQPPTREPWENAETDSL